VCIDCTAEGITTRRAAPNPGPRCHTHHNKKKRDRRIARKVAHVERTYNLTAEQYDALLAYQGGRCAICRVARGTAKRLAVDHDHHQAMIDGHAPDKGCEKCVRGLVCSTCNDVLAHARSDPRYGQRLAAYLTRWPMTRMGDSTPPGRWLEGV